MERPPTEVGGRFFFGRSLGVGQAVRAVFAPRQAGFIQPPGLNQAGDTPGAVAPAAGFC